MLKGISPVISPDLLKTLVGAKAAAPVAWRIARALYPGNNGPWFAKPADAERRTVQFLETPTESLAISKPEDGAKFVLEQGKGSQAVVCQVVGNSTGAHLWWFADGKPLGESDGARPFALDLERGEHLVTCATDGGEASSVHINIQ